MNGEGGQKKIDVKTVNLLRGEMNEILRARAQRVGYYHTWGSEKKKRQELELPKVVWLNSNT